MRKKSCALAWPLYGLLLLGALGSEGRAEAALTVSHLPTEAGALALANANGGGVRVTAEARIGGPTDWELGIRRDPLNLGDGTLTKTNFDAWLNGVPIPFLLVYDGRKSITASLVLSTVVNRSTFTIVGDFNEIFLVTQASDANSSIVFGNLSINGTAITGSSSASSSGAGAQDVLRLQGASLSKGFLLAGTIVMRWKGTKPLGIHLDSQVLLAHVVPPPADSAPPAIVITSPPAGALLSTSSPTLSATFSDSGSGVDPASIHLLLDRIDMTSDAEVQAGGFTLTPASPLGEGTHNATLIVRDRAANEGRAQVSFTIDTLAPELTFSSPPATVQDNTTPAIGVTFTDATSGVNPATFTLSLDGRDLTAACSVGTGSAACTSPTLQKGAHGLRATVQDRAGHLVTATTSFDVDLDDVPPTLAITEPHLPVVVGDPRPAVRVEYSDARSGIDPSSLRILLDGAALTAGCNVSPTLATCTPPELPAGPHTLTAVVRDLRGNLASAQASFTLSLPLALAFTEPQPERIVSSPVVRVTGTVSPRARSVRVNDVEATLQAGSFSIDALGLHHGVNDLIAVAQDDAGNTGMATVRVIADVTPPALSVSYPLDGAVVFSPQVDLSGRVNDLTIGTVSETVVTVAVNGRPATVNNRAFFVPAVPLSPGLNTLAVVATDRAGNRTTVPLHVTYSVPSGPSGIEPVSGGGQTAPILSALPTPLRVRLTDAAGQPRPGVLVVFRVVQGSGKLENGKRAQAATTDARGEATAGLTLGNRAGVATDRVRATATGIAGEALFSASASPGPAAAINVVSGDGQAGALGTALSRPLVAILTDTQQNPIVGAAVTFTVKKGGGHLPEGTDSLAVTTDESGLAAVPLTLGTEEGWDGNVVAASFDGMATFPATFRASAFLPGAPQATRITGVVLDNQGDPVPGVTMRLRGSTLSVLTNELGAFELSGVPVGQVFLIADASTTSRPGSWANLEFEMLTIAGINNSLPKPIYILPLDLPHGLTVDETHGGTLTIPGIPGFSLEVTPGSVTFPTGSRSGVVSVTAVHADRIPMAPGAGMQPRLIVTIQPAGARFDPPAAITFPNVDGRPPGTVTELFSFDHSIGAFVSIGTGTVSEDGRVLRSDPGFGVVEAGWHCGSPVTLNGLFTILHVKIKNHDPVILLVDQPPANQRLIEADGEPSDGVVYDWEGSDPAKVTLTPKGPHLCPDASFCQTLARAISIGETRATVTLICQFTRATSSATVRVVAAKIRLKEVSFSGTTYRAVAEDGKTTTYDAPHWQDNSSPPDGDANDPGDHRFPVSYTRGGKIRVSAVFTIEPDVKNAWENSSLDGFLIHCPDNSFAVVLNDSNFIQTFFSPYGGQ